MSLLTVSEVAKLLRVSSPTVRRLIDDNTLVAYDVGRQKRIDSANVARFLTRKNKGEDNYATNNQG